MQLALLDWIIVVGYVLAMLGVGLWAMTKIKDCGGYLLGKRKMGRWMMIAAAFCGGTSSQHPVAIASSSYTKGVSGVWLSLAYMFVTPFYWMMPPVFRRARIVTMVDFMGLRYGRVMEILYNVHSMIGGVLAMGVGIKAAATVIEMMSGGSMSAATAQLIVVGLVLAYGIPGGIIAAYATDLIQGILIVVLSFVLLPFAVEKIGGLQEVSNRVPENFLTLTNPDGIGFWWIFWFVVGTSFSAASWSLNAANGAARNEMAARWAVFGGLLKRFCTVGWMLVGVFAIATYGMYEAASSMDPDNVFAQMSGDMLPIGLRGLMLAAILAAIMSSADAGMVYVASIMVNNVYKEFFVPKASAAHYLLVARISGASLLVGGWLVATQMESLLHFLIIVEIFGSVMGLAVVTAFMWRRATAAGAVASVAVMSVIFTLISFKYDDLLLIAHIFPQIGDYVPLDNGSFPLTYQVPAYLIPGILIMIVVSLFTRQHNQKQVDDFYARLDTPLGEEHKLKEQGIEVDLLEELDNETVEVSAKDHDISKGLLLVDILRLPWLIAQGKAKITDYWIDIVGAVGWSAVVVLFLYGLQWLLYGLFG